MLYMFYMVKIVRRSPKPHQALSYELWNYFPKLLSART